MNPARALLKKHVDRMIANGSPVIAEIPAWHGTNAPLVLPSGQFHPCTDQKAIFYYGIGAVSCSYCGRNYSADDTPEHCSDDCPSSETAS